MTDIFLIELQTLLIKSKETFILGDFNLPNINWNKISNKNCLINKFFKILLEFGPFYQLINFKTRGDAILDLLFKNKPEIMGNINELPPIGNSDHCSIKFKLKFIKPVIFNKTIYMIIPKLITIKLIVLKTVLREIIYQILILYNTLGMSYIKFFKLFKKNLYQ